MSNIDIYKNEWLICELDPNLPVLIHRWIKNPGDAFRSQLLKLQETFIKFKDQYPGLMWLADTEHFGERSEEDE
jgi:hypothetical protein